MRSWSKWVIFSRRWWSCSSVGPRGPAFSEWSVSSSRAPVAVVRKAPCCAASVGSASTSAPVGVRVSGVAWSGLGGSGSRASVGSSSAAGALPGVPGMPGSSSFAAAFAALLAALPTVFLAV